ncbi:glutathione-dependent formaldehyde dehydrogenase [Sphaerisporangium siamense]|uniref:Threonine dehydrogenase-like Zn-dependent dehydrogenase n=1 Tax=Sphaerisporangium siamense TaxID=795645 RepID=A0A7W7DC17_9ACTN|nr:zinc-dependent alcohol dehydrogenase [Sphaerisporangium siamense]MBB4703265.1 threonine dehydrogenase-like Zn-dependent dehydrogenase [Sphaerisporangium siamense]GII88043.1 glutathione-dependent formaldehyde dehydrogenase [Sphaerisporangium siamense]
MKALCWQGVDELSVERVPDPEILNAQDAIVKVTMTGTCGSDLHLLGGYIPAMRAGDVIGHEFIGEVVDVGSEVRRHRVGDRVVVCSIIGCGRCWHCEHDMWSLCENSNVKPGVTDQVWGGATAGIFGFSHALGGFRGSHAEYVRVPFADEGAFAVPDGVDDVSALFASDAAPTGWMGADLGGVRPGDVVAVWGCGGVGQMAASAAILLGADRVIAIDKYPERLAMTERHVGAETLDYSRTDVIAELKERTGGRGPDVCIEAVGLEADSTRPRRLYGKAKQRLGLELDRPFAVREAIYACRTGGSVFILGVFAGLSDGFPLGAMMNKGLTVRGAQQHGHRYIPRLLDLIDRGELRTAHLATHTMSLDQAPRGYDMFKNKKDGCVRAVFRPWA